MTICSCIEHPSPTTEFVAYTLLTLYIFLVLLPTWIPLIMLWHVHTNLCQIYHIEIWLHHHIMAQIIPTSELDPISRYVPKLGRNIQICIITRVRQNYHCESSMLSQAMSKNRKINIHTVVLMKTIYWTDFLSSFWVNHLCYISNINH